MSQLMKHSSGRQVDRIVGAGTVAQEQTLASVLFPVFIHPVIVGRQLTVELVVV
ncbi:hypothetical protein D3C85_1637880 [compost metagenome]